MQLQWTVSPRAGALHAAWTLTHTGTVADRRLAEAIRAPAEALQRAVTAGPYSERLVWYHLIGLSAGGAEAGACVERAVERMRAAGSSGTPSTSGRPSGLPAVDAPHSDRSSADQELRELLAGAVGEVQEAVERAFPALADELQLRAGPLRQLWEARGPGMLGRLERQFGRKAPSPPADVVLVQPAQGGGGLAYPLDRRVVIEGVLANPVGDLPEVIRLGWLLAPLFFDPPLERRLADFERAWRLARLALVPATLEAAEYVELARCDAPTAERALEAWYLESTAPAEVAGSLISWWNEHRGSAEDWDTALARLALKKGVG